MANSITHARLPYPVRKARFTTAVVYLDSAGTPTDPTTPDTEISIDGAAFADCAEEVTTISGTATGSGYITFSGAEMDCAIAVVAAKAASGPKTSMLTLAPRDLPVILSGTASAGSSTSITLAAGDFDLTGCIVRTTGGTGGGGTGGANNQARMITAYNTSTKVATVPAWETTPDNTTTYEILQTEFAPNALQALRPTTAGRTLDVSSGGEAGVDWANVGSPTTTLNLSGTTVKTATDVETDTQDIQSRLPAALVSGRMNSDAVAISGSTTAADNVEANIGNLDAPVSVVDTVVDAIKAKTDNLPSDPADESLIIAATDAIYTRLGAPAGASIAADIAAIDSAIGASLSIAAEVDDGSPAAGSFDGDSSLSSADDFYNGSTLAFTSGTLHGLARRISDYAGTSRTLTFNEPFPSAPSNGDTFEILGRID